MQNLNQNKRAKLHELYASLTRPAKDYGYDLEKRLIRHFNDIRLRLRWHIKDKSLSVWYIDDRDGPYCIMNVSWPLDPAKVIKRLTDRLESPEAMLELYQKNQEVIQRDNNRKIDDISRNIAKDIANIVKRKVTVRTG